MVERVQTLVRHRERVLFHELVTPGAPRVEIAVAFWATLELFRRQVIAVEQPELFGPILIERGSQFA
jgi:segregation and condensation protein A